MADPRNEITQLLAGVPLFQGLSPGQLRELSRICKDVAFERGREIFAEGDPALGFYVVLAGRIKIVRISAEGKEQILHLVGAGEPFGEVAVFSGLNFPAHAEALEKSRALFFPKDDFIGLIRRDPGLALNMLAVLSRRLRRFAALIDDLSLKEVPARLAAYLLYLSGQEKGALELNLDISKTQLAGLLGTIPETLSRILSRMTRQGLIETDGPRIKLLDPAGLEALIDAGGRLRLQDISKIENESDDH